MDLYVDLLLRHEEVGAKYVDLGAKEDRGTAGVPPREKPLFAASARLLPRIGRIKKFKIALGDRLEDFRLVVGELGRVSGRKGDDSVVIWDC